MPFPQLEHLFMKTQIRCSFRKRNSDNVWRYHGLGMELPGHQARQLGQKDNGTKCDYSTDFFRAVP